MLNLERRCRRLRSPKRLCVAAEPLHGGLPMLHTLVQQVLLDALNEHTVDAGAGVDAVASFDNVNVMAPRGRFEVEMYLSFLKLIGQVRGL